jgi:hypothetical protein
MVTAPFGYRILRIDKIDTTHFLGKKYREVGLACQV